MKKILSFIIAALFIMTMSVNVFAAEVQTFTISISDATVDAGTETVTLTFTVTADVANWGATNLTIPVTIPEGLTYVEDSLSSTLAGTSLTVGTAAVPAVGLFSYDCEADDSDLIVDGTSTTFSATFAITDPSVAATYEITVLESGDFDIADEENWDSYVNLYETTFDTTDKGVITVNAAGPSVQADKKEKPVTITADEITLNDIKYTNVAVFNASHTLTLEDGEEITEAGIEVNDTSVLTFPALAGETGGTIEYNAIIYGVTGNLKVETYFAGNFFPEV